MFGTDDSVKKLEKEVASLEAKKADLERKHREAGQRRVELVGERQALLLRVADGDDNAARRELRGLDGKTQNLVEDEQSFAVAITDVTTKLAVTQRELDRARRQVQIDEAETQILALGAVEVELDGVLAQVHQTLDRFLGAVDGIGNALRDLDPKRFENTGPSLKQQISRAVLTKFIATGAGTKTGEDHFAVVRGGLRSAIAKLRYALIDGNVVPERGEKLFVVRVACPGLRGLDLRPGDRIALRDDEAVEFLKHGTLEPAV